MRNDLNSDADLSRRTRVEPWPRAGQKLRRISLACLMTLSAVPSSWAADLLLGPFNGLMSVDNGNTFSSQVVFNGSVIRTGRLGNDGIREYLVLGDLNVGAADRVMPSNLGTANGVRFVVGNNANLRGTFDFAGNTAGSGFGMAGGAFGGDPGLPPAPAVLASNPGARANGGTRGSGGEARRAAFGLVIWIPEAASLLSG